MKLKSLVIAAAAASALTIPTITQAGEKTVGIRAGYNTRATTAVAGVVFQYRFSRYFRLSPNVDYYFRHDGADALSLNANAHFPVASGVGGRLVFYPLAGLNYTSWNYHLDDEINDDASTRVSRLGLNGGAGLEFYATPSLKLSLEAKATFIKQYSSGTFSLSIGYVF